MEAFVLFGLCGQRGIRYVWEDFFIKRIIDDLIAASYALGVGGRDADEVMVGEEDNQLAAHAVTGISVFLVPPELITVSACFAWQRGGNAGIRKVGGGRFDIGSGNQLHSVDRPFVCNEIAEFQQVHGGCD